MFVSLNGPEYYIVVRGATNTAIFFHSLKKLVRLKPVARASKSVTLLWIIYRRIIMNEERFWRNGSILLTPY